MSIAVLGPLLVDDHPAFSPRDQVVLEALVTAAGTPLSTERLAEALWGDTPPVSWPKLIPSSILRIRKVLGPGSIETTPHGYRLAVHAETVDAVRFVHLVERGHRLLADGEADRARHVLREALTLWRGRPLAELVEWEPGRSEADRLDDLRRSAEEAVIDAGLRCGQHAEVVAEARLRVSQEPLREHRWAQLALARYLSGDQAEALATLREARRRIADELGLDPGPEIVDLEAAMLRQDANLVAAVALPEPSPECPYPGLRPLDVDDGELFFGRESEVTACLERLERDRVLVISGPSGCGKSSLVRAGVVASLRRAARPVLLLGPGPDAVDELVTRAGSRWSGTLVLDQLEEVVAGAGDDDRARLVDALVQQSRTGRLVLAVRADHLGDLADHAELARLVERGLLLVGPMGEEALRRAVLAPATEASLSLEPGLVDMLLGEVVDAPGALPLMAHALEQTWRRREGRTLTVAGYRDAGGIAGAVAQSAEEVFEVLGEEERSELRDLLLRLVTVSPDGDPVRAWVPVRQLSHAGGGRLVDLLARARLVTVDDGVVAVAHESLVRAWPRLRAWLEDDVEGQHVRRHLTAAADSWDVLDRPDSELYRGVRLARVLDWRARQSSPLTPTEDEFLAASRQVAAREEAHDRVVEAQRRRQVRRIRSLVTGVVALLVVASAAGGVALVERRNATESSRARTAATAASIARETNDPTLALVAGVEAVRVRDGADARDALLDSLTRWPGLLASRVVDEGRVLAVTPDGRVAVGGPQGLRLLDPLTLADERFFPGGVSTLTSMPDGRTVLLGTTGQELVALDTESGRQGLFTDEAMPQDGWPWGLTASADGSVVAVGVYAPEGSGGGVLVRSASGTRTHSQGLPVIDLRLSPDGRRLYLLLQGDSGRTELSVHDPLSGRRLTSTTVEETTSAPDTQADAWRLAVSRDGSMVAVGGGLVTVLDAGTLKVMARMTNGSGQTVSLTFSDDGSLLAGGSDERAITVWDIERGGSERIDDLSETVAELAFSRDGRTLYSLTTDHRLSAWDTGGERRLIQRLVPTMTPGAIEGPLVVPAPDGDVVAYMSATPSAGDRQSRIDLLDVSARRLLEPLSGTYQNWGVWQPPDFDRLAVPGDRVVRVWDWRTGRTVLEREAGESAVESLAWTPDGRGLIVGERSGHVQLVDASDLMPSGPRTAVAGSLLEVIWAGEGRALAILSAAETVVATLVDLASGEQLLSRPLGIVVTHADVSPDGRLLAVGGQSGQVGILDLERDRWVKRPEPEHQGWLLRVDFSSDGGLLVSSGEDGRVRLWDGRTGEARESTVIGRVGVPSSALFLPDGHTLLLTAADGGVRRWDTRVATWVRAACDRVGRGFTEDEWSLAFGGDVPYSRPCARGRV